MEVGVEQLVSEQLKSECTNICPNVATILFLVLHSSAHFLSTNYLRAMTCNMNKLCRQVQTILLRHSYLLPFTKDFNHCQFSVYGTKGLKDKHAPSIIQTGLHCDTSYSFSKARGIQCLPSRNSQEENSIVAILTVGHSRTLTMERVVWNDGPTDNVLETRYFLLSHNSLFILHPLDERPSTRDHNSVLSYWRHGNVRMVCTNPSCYEKCSPVCRDINKNNASFAIAFRSCSHTRIIDHSTSLEPLADEVRSQLNLHKLDELQVQRNIEATEMLQTYASNGGEDTFKEWLHLSLQKVLSDFYSNK